MEMARTRNRHPYFKSKSAVRSVLHALLFLPLLFLVSFYQPSVCLPPPRLLSFSLSFPLPFPTYCTKSKSAPARVCVRGVHGYDAPAARCWQRWVRAAAHGPGAARRALASSDCELSERTSDAPACSLLFITYRAYFYDSPRAKRPKRCAKLQTYVRAHTKSTRGTCKKIASRDFDPTQLQ